MSIVNADNLATAGEDYTQLADLYHLKFLTARMDKNAANFANTSGRIITVVNTNLYVLADKYYGDAKQWTVIAEANGLKDPQIYGQVSLIIPEWDGVDRGGEFGDRQLQALT